MATSSMMRLRRQWPSTGLVKAGAFADLLVVDGDPLADIRVLGGQGERIVGVLKAGAWASRTGV